MKKIFIYAQVFLLASCIKDSDYGAPTKVQSKASLELAAIVGKRVSLEEITQKATPTIQPYHDDEVFEGVVISSDFSGNFYKKIYVQALDKSGAIVVNVDKKNLFTEYPIGSEVVVRLKETTFWLNERYSTVEVGYGQGQTSSGNIKMANLPASMLLSVLVKTGKVLPLDEIVTEVTSLKSLNKAKSFNKLLLLKNVRFEDAAIGKPYHQKTNQYNTSYNLLGADGGTVSFYTSAFASHISEKVPAGNLQVLGVLTKYNSSYQFNVNSVKDIQK